MWGPPASPPPPNRPLPSLTPRVHDPSPPHLARPPLPHPGLTRRRCRPTARSEPRSSLPLLSSPPSSLGLGRLGARRRALGTRPWWPRCPAPRGSRRRRSPAPAHGGPGPPVPARRLPPRARVAPCPGLGAARPCRPWRARAAPLLRSWHGPASAAPARSPSPASTPTWWRGACPARAPGPSPRPCPCPARCARGHGARRPSSRGPVPARGPRAWPWRGPLLGAAFPAPTRLAPIQPRPCPERSWRARPARRPCSRRSAACPRPAWLPSPNRRPGVLAMARLGPCPCTTWPLRSATRAQLGPSVCATRSRRVSAALRARAREARAVLWHSSPCPRCARLPLDVPVYPPCTSCVVIALFISINGTQFRNWLR
jgi:hypothetical protein